MKFVQWLYSSIKITPLLFSVQGCSTPLYDVVLPRIDRDNGWSVDAANYFIYRESIIGPRLSLLISPDLRSGYLPKPLGIDLIFLNSFDATISLDPRQIVLEIGGQRYTASLETCSSPVGNIPVASLGERVVTLQELSREPMAPCLYLLFDAQQPDDWTKVSLHINGLFKNDQRLTVPEIRFYKTQRKAPGSFM